MAPQYLLAPSLLAADFTRLGAEVHDVILAGADWIHFDVMDNHYVPNLTMGPMICAALRPLTQAFIDVHLMVKPVDRLIPDFAKAGANLISFHPEASEHIDRSLALIRDCGCQTGLVFNPATPLIYLDHVLDKLDLVLLMGVNPGFGGQVFIPETLRKIALVRQKINAYQQTSGRKIRLQIDGGVKADNIATIAQAGADTFVAGSAIFGAAKTTDAHRYDSVIGEFRAQLAGCAMNKLNNLNNLNKRAIDAVLFDLDGTLLDTVPDLHAAACGMLHDLGRPEVPISATRSYVGRGMVSLVKRLLAGSLELNDDSPPPPAALASFRRHYTQENGRNAQLYPGVIEGLDAFKAKGIPLAVVTNKPYDFSASLLKQTQLDAYFDALIGGDSLPHHKPDPMPLIWACGRLNVSPNKTLFIGDSVNDFLAARAAGCPIFLLPYGYNEGRDVHELAADAIISSVLAAIEHIQ